MKKTKKLLSLLLALTLALSLAVPAFADSYAPLIVGYGEDYGNYGFYFEDVLKFDAVTQKELPEGVLLLTMKKGSSIHFFQNQADGFVIEEGSISYSAYARTDSGVETDSYVNTIDSVDYSLLAEDRYFFVTEKKSLSTDDIFTNGIAMIEIYSSDRHYCVVPEGGVSVTPPALTATPTPSSFQLNGQQVSFDAYTINGNNYFKLRDLAYTLSGSEKQFEVSWDAAANAIRLTSGQAYTVVGGEMVGKGSEAKSPLPTSSVLYVDGVEHSLTAYQIEGNNYFKLRDIGSIFDFEVDWDGANNTIVVDTSKSYTAD